MCQILQSRVLLFLLNFLISGRCHQRLTLVKDNHKENLLRSATLSEVRKVNLNALRSESLVQNKHKGIQKLSEGDDIYCQHWEYFNSEETFLFTLDPENDLNGEEICSHFDFQVQLKSKKKRRLNMECNYLEIQQGSVALTTGKKEFNLDVAGQNDTMDCKVYPLKRKIADKIKKKNYGEVKEFSGDVIRDCDFTKTLDYNETVVLVSDHYFKSISKKFQCKHRNIGIQTKSDDHNVILTCSDFALNSADTMVIVDKNAFSMSIIGKYPRYQCQIQLKPSDATETSTKVDAVNQEITSEKNPGTASDISKPEN